MRVPLSWLRELVEFDLTPEQLAERLTLLGMEVKGIEARGSEWANVVVGELLAVEKHPRADRLSLTRVTIGAGEPLEVVCGATNIAVGQRVPVALPGAVLPGNRRIERTEKMGVVSNGMLCSGDELGLTSDADGILILAPETPLGAHLADLYGDDVLDVDVKPNRGDALSIVGVAREVAAVTGGTVKLPATEVVEDPALVTPDLLAVGVEDERLCPRFVGRWVQDVTVKPSPDWVQMRLLAAGIRPISNVVDASNYVMVELGKPIHTFDAAAVGRDINGRSTIIVRNARAGERLETLDHVVRELTPNTLLIADEQGPLGIAGVMGGADSEVSAVTSCVIVESAIFDSVAIRRTAFRYALRSDASLRFEKGQEFRLAKVGADRTARLIAEWAGGRVATGSIDTNPDEPAPKRVAFRPARIDRLLGTDLGAAAQREVLARVGISTEPADGPIDVVIAAGDNPESVMAAAGGAVVATVPTWRRDIEIEADLAEEVARVHGYERVPGRLPATPLPEWRESPLVARDAIRETLVGAGLTEVVSYALVSPRLDETFAWLDRRAPARGEAVAEGGSISVANPLSSDHSILRQTLIGSLVEVVQRNQRHGTEDIRAFEVGKGYGKVGDEPREWWRLGLALAGAFEPAAWNRPRRQADIDDAKGSIALLADRIGAEAPTFLPLATEPILHPGRSATVEARFGDGEAAITGVVGELHPRLLADWDLRGPVIVAEVSVAGLGGGSLPVVVAEPLPRVQPIERDLTVDVPDRVPAVEVVARIREAGRPLLQNAVVTGTYRGKPLREDERSLTYRLRFGAADRALQEQEVEAAISTITASLEHHLGARIRS
ncbi:MAG TPA: phenylalanine--tRNA ligase subunit beta [Candidatus Limnocylindrales bacterium]|nr:phenylalanine--tRNA ligase subunit beta [Candidatus Limnocylindrales bacterium]